MLFLPVIVYFFGVSNEQVIYLYIDLYITFQHAEPTF